MENYDVLLKFLDDRKALEYHSTTKDDFYIYVDSSNRPDKVCAEAAAAIRALQAEIERLEKLHREAATYVESVICMRTHFTGQPPYVGWKGLGLALKEVLDERDKSKFPDSQTP